MNSMSSFIVFTVVATIFNTLFDYENVQTLIIIVLKFGNSQ